MLLPHLKPSLCVQSALQELAFQNVGCSIRACQAVAELVKHPQELRRLHLHNNMSDDAGAAAIAQAGPFMHALLHPFASSGKGRHARLLTLLRPAWPLCALLHAQSQQLGLPETCCECYWCC